MSNLHPPAKKRKTGELRFRGNRWETRLRITPKQRRSFAMPWARSEAEAVERASSLAELVSRFQKAKLIHMSQALQLLELIAAQDDAKRLSLYLQAAEQMLAGKAPRPGTPRRKAKTWGEVATAWVEGGLHRDWPDHVRRVTATQANDSRVKVLRQSIGDVPVEAFRLEHAEHAMRQLPEGLEATTRRHYAQIIRKVLQYCVYPLRAIEANPVPTSFLPKPSKQKAHQWLYPAEDAALLACKAIPLPWRLFWGFLYREGPRCSEALALNVGDVDLNTGVLTLDKNKTNDPRAWALRPDVREALKRWVDQREAKPADPLFVGEDGKRLYDEHMARLFR